MSTAHWTGERSESDVNRRAFLQQAAVTAGAAWLGPVALGDLARSARAADAAATTPSGLIVRQRNPDNFEFPFATLDRFITPNERFYVRNHFPKPTLEARSWALRVEGAVRENLLLTYEALRRLPARTLTATLECAGNSRSFLTPAARGVQWSLGAVSTAEWTGVPLNVILQQVGLRDAAVEIVLEGADQGPAPNEPTLGTIRYARSIPVARAQRNVLLAYRMNGVDLPPEHGFPVRAIVPGWYGMASVKWLTRIVVTDHPFEGFWQTLDYTIFQRNRGLPVITPLAEMQVKAQIARPRAQETVPANTAYRVHGAAWTGDADVARVEVSTDGGRSWTPARLLGEPVRHAWRLWEYEWRTPGQPGRVRLAARATDTRGRTQPLERNPDRRNYMISHVLPVEVEVR
jgi:DMSO/TMAO reductase YedYZ molybdopterin-dependent catalytic subunit